MTILELSIRYDIVQSRKRVQWSQGLLVHTLTLVFSICPCLLTTVTIYMTENKGKHVWKQQYKSVCNSFWLHISCFIPLMYWLKSLTSLTQSLKLWKLETTMWLSPRVSTALTLEKTWVLTPPWVLDILLPRIQTFLQCFKVLLSNNSPGFLKVF